MILAGIKVIDTPLVRDAIDLAKSSSEPYIFNHVMRSWLFAVSIAEATRPSLNPELLAVAAILHDLGLTDRYFGTERFEVDGANAARTFLTEHGIRLSTGRDTYGFELSRSRSGGNKRRAERNVDLRTSRRTTCTQATTARPDLSALSENS